MGKREELEELVRRTEQEVKEKVEALKQLPEEALFNWLRKHNK